ncbi:MAG: universal stress protein, partial [Ruminococcaceae bacterium]|nr:universal stress protein [Oscillospiraceae bacterium]
SSMFSRLLIASDITSSTFAVINCISDLKAFGARECLLLGCITLYPYSHLPEISVQTLMERSLEEQQELLEKEGFKVSSRCVVGVPENIINRIAEEEDFSAIVVGSFTRTWAGEALLGGLASDIIHTASKPVLLVRLETQKVSGEGERPASEVTAVSCDFSNHILFPTDFSQNADYAFSYVKQLVEAGVRKVTLMHVQDKYRIEPFLLDRLDEFNRIDESRLQQMKGILTSLRDVVVDIRIAYGSPAAEILKLIRDTEASLTVMGSQGRGFARDMFLGNVSHTIARRSPSSVFLIPEPKEHINV